MTRLPDPHDTIAAVSSAPGRSARSLVRITGPNTWAVLDAVCPGWRDAPEDRPARVARVASQARLPGVVSPLPVMLLVWPAPRTYTGQDLAELHTFGCPPLIDALMSQTLQVPQVRLAEPGEFTLRAFLAGKLDLTQAEALLDLLHAEDLDAMKAALARMAGGIGKPLQAIRSALLDLLAEIEAGLDFAEEDLSFLPAEVVVERLRGEERRLADLETQLRERDLTLRPFRVVLAGPPNAGKSSLFNALVGEAAALVSPRPGTTRDWLERTVLWDQVEIALFDSAGLGNEPVDELDRLAREAGQIVLRDADLILLCLPPQVQDHQTDHIIPGGGNPGRVVRVRTKCDLNSSGEDPSGTLATSAVTGEGLERLRREIVCRAMQRRSGFVSASRCRQALQAARRHVAEAAGFVAGHLAEMAAVELRSALEALGEVVGAVCTDELLDRIFSQFCIGK